MTTTNDLGAIHPTLPAGLEDPAAAAEPGPGDVETVIRANPGWIAVNWGEIAQSHELFYTLVQRDLMIRYKQTVLGVAWAVIQPVFTMIVFTVLFGRLPGIKTDVPYPLFVYAGLVPWTFFASSVTGAGMSLLANHNLLTKIYFPRLYVPASTIGGFLIDLAIGLSLFGVMMPYYHYAPSWNLLFLPLVVFLNFATALGIGLALAAMTILYRDLRFVVPFVLQLAMFLSGVILPMDSFSWPVQVAVALNPMYGIISAYRSTILGLPWDLPALAASVVMTAGILAFSLFFFRKTERLIADIA